MPQNWACENGPCLKVVYNAALNGVAGQVPRTVHLKQVSVSGTNALNLRAREST